ncbi:MAG: DNA mismatch repair endonuclease MutL [Cyanobacteria bacterium P01_A01_bin.123]
MALLNSIQTLPTDVVHLMAAGEVIDSPAAAVRELIENAIDAGATRLTLAFWPEQWRMRVTDNGYGMALADLQQAACPHSTSKINSSDDLWRITSLGFRGEALHSLSQLADLDICSRISPLGMPTTPAPDNDPDNGAGWRVVYDHQGQPVDTQTTAIAPGTVVTVSNLFARWPARRAGLPTVPQQLRAMQRVIQQMALCHPQLTWQVDLRDRSWFQLWPGENAQAILPQILRTVAPSDLRAVEVPVEWEETNLETASPECGDASQAQGTQDCDRISLLIGLPDRCHRRRPDWVQLALNGRPIQAPALEQAVITGFRRTLPRDRFPVCFLHIHASPDQIDWNRHPAKSEIYLHHVDCWQQHIITAIDRALQQNPDSLGTDPDRRTADMLKTAEAQGVYGFGRSIQPGLADQSGLKALRAIAQVHQTYILAESAAGVCLIEQHIAHERVLFEQLEDHWQLVPQDPPVILNQLSTAQVTQLQKLGVDIALFGEDLWAVRSIPEPLAQRQDREDALRELSLGGDLQSALVATACRTAIRNGTPLNLSDMQTLLNQWQATRNPHTCPHGRPICLNLKESSLSRYFRRHWVIGKSHGI